MIVYQDERTTIFQSALYQTNTTFYNANEFVLLVDPNWLANEVQFIKAYIDQHFPDEPIYLLFTHSDYDHIIGYKAFPHATIIASAGMQNRTDKDRILNEIRQFDQDHYISRSYPIAYPEIDLVIDQDAMQLEIRGERFTFYHAPGHTDDGLVTMVESGQLLIVGDYLSDLEFPFIYHNSAAYLRTLGKMERILQQHPVRLLIPGHGSYLLDQTGEILKRIERDRAYLEELRACVRNDVPFPLDNWLRAFPFPEGLREQQRKNEKHIRQEFLS